MILQILFVGIVLVNTINAQGYYNAAVMEYAPQQRDSGLTDEQYVLTNVRQYISFIQQARARLSNIIVFPEYGLTTTILPLDLTNVSTPVPEASLRIAPCDGNVTTYSTFLIDLSCAAREHGIYTVVNLLEREFRNDTNTTLFYNTNVVFDATGSVIARYRKINLFNEPQLTPGDQAVTFVAFDVTFGLLTCFDILFRNPAQEVLNQGATDIIFPNAWTSETPFHQSFSIQDGYSKAAGVNLLASGYSNITNGMAGAAIFSGNASIPVSALSPAAVQNILVATLGRLNTRTPDAVCNNNINVEPRIGLLPELTAVYQVLQENLEHYTFQNLELNVNATRGQVCSEGSNFCCDYDIEFNNPFTVNSTVYKMVAFYGRRGFQGANATTIGVRTCALVHCSSEDNTTCGLFNATTNVNFRRISISATLPSNNNTFYQPTTLDTNHRPLERYAYCTAEDGDHLGITLTIENQQNLFTFGILGRAYSIDGQTEGRGSASGLNAGLITLLSLCFCVMLRNY